MIVTQGGENVTWGNRLYFPPKVDAYDVCGAGDTFLAALVFEYLQKQ
jgi:sugar/nucleoside kinase (ribokinase family)